MSAAQEIHKIWLTYSNPKEQKQYYEREFIQESPMIGNFLLFAGVVAVGIVISQIVWNSLYEFSANIWINIGCAAILFAGFLLIKFPCCKKFIQYSKMILTLIFVLFLIAFDFGLNMEYTNKDYSRMWVDMIDTCTSFMVVQFAQDIMLIFGWKWYVSLTVHIANQIFFLRFPLNQDCKDDSGCKQLKFSGAIKMTIISLWLLYLDYLTSKMKVEQFHDIFKNECYLDQFKIFLKELVPTPIIIGNFVRNNNLAEKKQQLAFFNDPVFSILGENQIEIEKNIWSIKTDFSGASNFIEKRRESIQAINSEAIILNFKNDFPLLENTYNCLSQLELNNFYTITCSQQPAIIANTKKKQFFEVKIAKIKWEGKEEIALCFHDIGIYKEFDEFKNKLLANVSHNLRTPINTVQANLEIAIEQEKSKQIKKLLKISKMACFLLISAVNDLLDYSQICIGSLKISRTWIKLKDLLKDVIKTIKTQAKLKGLLFSWETNADLECKIYSDPDRLKQILLNLLNNAVKFTAHGFISFTITHYIQISKIEFAIKDTGVGMRPEHVRKIFKLFQKDEGLEDNSYNIQGVGLGLKVSNELLKKLENTRENLIKVNTSLGNGSTFSFKVNAAPQRDEMSEIIGLENQNTPISLLEINAELHMNNEKNTIIPKTMDSKPLQKAKNEMVALVVDDEPFCADVVQKLLCWQGIFNIKIGTSGKEALEIIINEAKNGRFFDIIVMDCNMPVMDGFEATKEIKKMVARKEINKVDVIALTANIATADENSCKAAGMDFYLKKPVKKGDFSAVLNKIFNFEA